MTALRLPPSRAMGAKDIRHLQGVTSHGRSLGRSRRLQRTDDFAQRFGCHLGIQRSGIEPLVPEQHLDDANIDLLFQQVRRKTVAKRMHANTLVDTGCLRGITHGAVELTRAQGLDRI